MVIHGQPLFGIFDAWSGSDLAAFCNNPAVIITLLVMVIVATWGRYFHWLSRGMQAMEDEGHPCHWVIRVLRRLRWFLIRAFGIALPVFVTMQALEALPS